ncbi:MAG TPA: hypothetical protein VFX28_17395 [Methylomirabilota bacterium]|nr:hypothetical protein [Methylomirabilota bacterium]
MTTAVRTLAAALVVALLLGPLTPLAQAQQPAQPDLFQEALKGAREAEKNQGAYEVGAGIANVFHVPGRAITCVLGTTVGLGLMLLTLGTGYKAAAGVATEGCGGKWILTGDDLRPDPPTSRPFDWERP